MAMKFTFLFLNLAKIHICIPKSAYVGGGRSAGLGTDKYKKDIEKLLLLEPYLNLVYHFHIVINSGSENSTKGQMSDTQFFKFVGFKKNTCKGTRKPRGKARGSTFYGSKVRIAYLLLRRSS